MPNPWEQDWGGNTATEVAPWEQSWSDSPADKPRPTVELEPVPGYLKVAARADSGVRKAGLNIMRMADAAQDFLGLPGAVTAVTGNDTYEKAIAGNLQYYNAREAQLSQQDAALDDNSVAGQFTEGLVRGVTELPVQLIPGAAARNVGQAVKISAATAGAMGGLSSYGQDVGAGKPRSEAIPYAIASGGITALTTAAFGSSGVESIFKEKLAGTLRNKVVAVLKGIGAEATEEMVDQVQQDFIERVDRNRDKSVAESFKDVLMAGGIGGTIGGAVTAVGQVGMPQRGNTEAKTLETELTGLSGLKTEPAANNAVAVPPWEVDFQSGLNEAPATGTASPVERFIYEQKARQEAAAKTQDSTPEPMPWEMEYAGGEMPSESGKGLEAKVLSLESTTRATRPTPQDSVPAETLSPAAQEMPAPTMTAPSRAVETTQAASAAAAGVKLTTETQRAQSEIPTATAIDPSMVQTVEFPIANLSLSKDVPNFKGGASETTGTVAGQELAGKYERRGTAPIVAWERLNGKTEVITGRHRFDLAKRTGEKTIPTQVLREADGFTKDMALTFDAEANIRDGQGEVTDYAIYFKGTNITPDAAQARGLLSRAKGKAGWSLAKAASDDVYALWQADKLTDAQAVAIANAAPGDAGAQAIGSKFALQGKSPDFISNVIKASRAEAGTRAQSLDLFGADDSAMKAMEEQASRASGFQREIAEQIRAVQGAAKRPEVARKLGVDVKDPEAINAKITALKAELERWENWPLQPDLVAQVRGEPAPVVAPKLRAGEKGTGDLLQGEDAPFNLAGEKASDGERIAAAKAQADANARALAEFEAKNQTQFGGLEAWADKQLKGGGMKFGSGPDPAQATRFAAAVAIKGSYVIARGVRDFAAWSAEMIRQLPELANATAEQLRALYARSLDIAEGRDPEIGLSVRGMKVKADTSLSEEVRQNTEAAYAKRVSADDVTEAKRLVQAAGGPEAAARDMLSGLWKPVPDTVQVKGAGEILAGLAALERRANDIATQERLADLQVRIAEHSTALATRPAQWLQAFASLYGNYSPAAWLKEWRKGIDAAAKTRIERATGKPTGNTAPEMAQDIAGAVAEGVRADAPTTAAVIESVYGGKGKPGETATQAVERIIGAKGEKAQRVAKKIQDFYEKEVNKFKKKHKIPELSPEDQRTVLAEAKAIERLPADSLQRREAVLKLLDSLHRRKGFEWWELPVSFWYANVLSGPTTHAKNILGNSVNLGMEAGLQSLLKPTNIPVILESLGRSLSVGAKEAWSILQTGHDTAARHGDKFELRRNPLELQSGGLDKVLLPWKLVGRLLRAEDAVFFNAGQELRAAILARRAAGGDTAAMREAMGWTADARAKAEAQATSEGLTGLNLQRRVNEIIEQGRSNEVMNAAREFGYDVTFNNEPYGVLGAFTNKINEMFQAAPILKPFVLPFTRIVANVFNSSVNWTPVGTYRALRGQRKLGWLGRAENSGKLYGREINDPLAIRDAHARAMLGTAAIIAVAAAAIKNVFDEEPEFMVTGSGPANKEQRDALRAAGWIPYSVKIGGRYYSYADKPPQIALSIVGHYLDAIRYKNLNREDALNRVTYALNGSFNVILQSSWMQGLNSIFGQANRESIKNPQRGLVDQITKTGSGFVVPSLLKQTDQFFDPQKYSPQDVQGMLMAQVPWARRTGQPDLNAFGQPVYSPTSKIFWSKPEGDTLVRKLAGARVFPGTPNQGDLTDKEHYSLVKFRGPILREMLAERADEWVGAPRLIAQDIVNSISSSATEKAKAELGLDEANKERREFRKVTTK